MSPSIVVIGLAIGSVKFLDPNEEHGWRFAGTAIPVLYMPMKAPGHPSHVGSAER
jgi:hypothetical protein